MTEKTLNAVGASFPVGDKDVMARFVEAGIENHRTRSSMFSNTVTVTFGCWLVAVTTRT